VAGVEAMGDRLMARTKQRGGSSVQDFAGEALGPAPEEPGRGSLIERWHRGLRELAQGGGRKTSRMPGSVGSLQKDSGSREMQ